MNSFTTPSPTGGPVAVQPGYTDRPIQKKGQDQFNYQTYAVALADVVEQAETPVTIGIYGRWGSGKSSLMRLLDEELQGRAVEKGRPIKTTWINVWQFSNQEEIWQAFLQALFTKVNQELSLWQRIDKLKLANQIARNGLRILLVITPLLLAQLLVGSDATLDQTSAQMIAQGGILATLGLGLWVLVRLKPIIEAAQETAKIDLREALKYGSYEAQISALMRLERQFERMVNTLIPQGGRLVVFIDDLDRCQPSAIPDVLEALKLFTTSGRCVYVLGLNHDIILQGVIGKYKFSEDEAAEYVEKIVQVPFQLPPLDRGRIADFVKANYPDLIAACPDAPGIFSIGLEPNPRKIKRELSIYRTLLTLAEARMKLEELDPVDAELLAKLVVIQSRFRGLYKAIVRDPELLTALEDWAEYRDYPDQADEATRKRVEAARARLEAKDAVTSRPMVPPVDYPALAMMLQEGDSRFGALDTDELNIYIYLTGTAASRDVVFEYTTTLVPAIQKKLENSLARFRRYFENLGYKPSRGERVRVRVAADVPGLANYLPKENLISINDTVANDPDVAFREYAHHVLTSAIEERSGPLDFFGKLGAIESGMADYFPCSFTGNPQLGRIMAKLYDREYIRDLENTRRFDEVPADSHPWGTGEVWAAVFWEMRKLLGQAAADKLLFQAWTSIRQADLKGDIAVKFVKRLIEQIQKDGDEYQAEQIHAIFSRRGVKLKPLASTTPSQAP